MKKVKTLIAMVVMAMIITACTVPEPVQVQLPDGSIVTVTNQVVDPRVITGIETAKVVNTATAPVNPYSGIITILLGLATAGATAWGTIATALKNRQTKLLTTVVQGVEQANNADTKWAIENHSKNMGVKLELDNEVQKIVS